MQKKVKTNKKRFIVFVVIILCFTIGLIFLLTNDKKENKSNEPKMKLTFKNRINDATIYKYLDYYTVGWLQVQGTNIDYPILNHDAGSIDPTKLNFGWRSPLYQSGENREVIIGHNIVNISSEPTKDMEVLNNFEGLMAFTYEDFAKQNLYISYTKGNNDSIYKIFGVYFKSYYEESASSLNDDSKINEYISSVKKNSIYDYDVDVNKSDHIIVIKTCTRYFGLYENQEFIVVARKVRENETITKYKVTKNDNYKLLAEGISKENG